MVPARLLPMLMAYRIRSAPVEVSSGAWDFPVDAVIADVGVSSVSVT